MLYRVTYSYPTLDRYHRGQRTITIEGRTEAEARANLRALLAPGSVRVLRISPTDA